MDLGDLRYVQPLNCSNISFESMCEIYFSLFFCKKLTSKSLHSSSDSYISEKLSVDF